MNTDSSFLIVNKYLRDENTLSLKREYSYYDTQKYVSSAIPIPNFYGIKEFSELTPHKLKKDFVLYGFENKAGKFWNEKFHQGVWHMRSEEHTSELQSH